MSKPFFGAKSRRLKDKQEFLEKLKFREDTEKIIHNCNKKKKEIDEQKKHIASLFIHSNEKEDLLKNYIALINKKMYETTIDIDTQIERASNEIIDMISEIQVKIKKAIEYTKIEMEKEIEDKFAEAERKQQEKMKEKIRERNELIKKTNESRFELDKIKIIFDETDQECSRLFKINERLKVDLDTVKSDNENLTKKLEEIQKDNQKIEEEYHYYFGKEEKNHDKPSQINESASSKNEITNKPNISEIKADDKQEEKDSESKINNLSTDEDIFSPKNLIALLKESIKGLRRESEEIYMKIGEQKKQKKEVSQLLQKCIDDLNQELKKVNMSLPDINPYKLEKDQKRDIFENNLKILSYVFDNSLGGSKKRKLIIKK